MGFSVTRTVRTATPPEAAWRVLAQVDAWNKFDAHLSWSQIFGDFETGTTGVVKPRTGPRREFTIAEAAPNRSFTASMAMPLCVMRFTHVIEPDGGGARVTFGIEMTGPCAALYGLLIGGRMTRGLEASLAPFAALAEKEWADNDV
ncbi:MAG: SRPBCC family protein [Deltaproteobacteria bacterium]|nr:SRPBCC family protein [Deltaproteobacteria bacterium]